MSETTHPGGEEPATSWRKRHPALARALLYGGAAALVGGVAFGWAVPRARANRDAAEKDRQVSLVTRIEGAQLVRGLDPQRALRILRDDVLAQSPNDDVRRKARLEEAATLDFLKRYDEAVAIYVDLERAWPADTPRGPLHVPWANLLVSAGKPAEALAMLDRPGAVLGWPEDEVRMVRERAEKAKAAGAPGGAGR